MGQIAEGWWTTRGGLSAAPLMRVPWLVIPAQAGIQFLLCKRKKNWIPAYAGMTTVGVGSRVIAPDCAARMTVAVPLDPVSTHLPVLHGMTAAVSLDPVSSHLPVLHGMSSS